MENEFINLNIDNIENEHLSCIIRTKTKNPGVEKKRAWLKDRIKEGHIFRKLNKKETVFIEYAPLEKAWVPIEGNNYFYIYCLWVTGECKGKGYGKELMQYCIDDAIKKGKSGICMLASVKQKAWLANQEFAKRFGFKKVDEVGEYELLALTFNNELPKFCDSVRKDKIDEKGLVIYYSDQCPFITLYLDMIEKYCIEEKIEYSFKHIDSLKETKELPCVFNNWALFYNGVFQTVNLLNLDSLKRIIKKASI